MQRVELLAPAGNYETMLGAINAGADAVYLGGEGFGARAFADNFTNEEVIAAIKYAHLLGKKIYLTVNTLLKEKEVEDFRRFFAPFAYAGLDAAIIQDLGIFKIVKDEFPWVDIHASTQMTITGPEGARMLLDLGATRVVPARELSLKEIKGMHDYCLMDDRGGIEIEAFVHGAMCYSYSGACLFSSMVGERSGNRGRCAQPCRLPYKLNGHGKECYPLSLKDMCLVDRVPELIEAGIDSFKIEGRMKKPEYAAGVVSIYRKYIDDYYEKGLREKATEADKKVLSTLYLRSEIGEGYYFRHNSPDMVTLQDPSYNKQNEDTLNKIHETYLENRKKFPVSLKCNIEAGKNIEIELISEDKELDARIKLAGQVADKARNRPMTKADIEKQLKKFGDTDLELKNLSVNLGQEGVFVPVKVLNELRRQAVSEFIEKVYELRGYKEHDFSEFEETGYKNNDKKISSLTGAISKPQLHVSVMTYAQLHNVCEISRLNGNISRIYVDSRILALDNEIPDHGQADIYVMLPYVMRSEDNIPDKFDLKNVLEKADNKGFKGVLLRNMEELSYVLKSGYKGKLVPDYGLYIWNHMAYAEMKDIFKGDIFDEFSLPLELNIYENEDLLKGIYGSILSENERKQLSLPTATMQIYGRTPMMLSSNCIRNTFKDCTKKRASMCEYDTIYINDRTGRTMPVTYDCRYCMNIIWNSAVTSLFKKIDRIKAFAKNYNTYLRIDFTVEKAKDVSEILKAYEQLVQDKKPGDELLTAVLRDMDYTAGHFEKSAD
ncbi:MAG: U32 family peptidase [Butyrivibrio sp.]|nr:U32 family peptidase [Butyrivibrio sp.]